MAAENGTLYMVYNADGSVMGKLRYGYRKLTADSNCGPVCAACDITHGGISLSETPAWVKAKNEVEKESKLKVVQLHRDELSPSLKDYIKTNSVSLPVAIVERSTANYEVLLDRSDLARCEGSADKFVQELREKQQTPKASL